MSYKNILVPYDGSDHSKTALCEAIKMVGNDQEAEIHVVEVSAPPQDLVFSSFSSSGFSFGNELIAKEDFADVVKQREEASDHELRSDVAEIVEDFGGQLTVEVVYGVYTVETIVEMSKRYGCDLICMGSRGLGAIRGMLGSISYGVLRSADIPVLICK